MLIAAGAFTAGILAKEWNAPFWITLPAATLMGALIGVVFGLPSLRPRTTWLGPVLALGAVALPQAMIYPGIVWKDVLFAVATLSGGRCCWTSGRSSGCGT